MIELLENYRKYATVFEHLFKNYSHISSWFQFGVKG